MKKKCDGSSAGILMIPKRFRDRLENWGDLPPVVIRKRIRNVVVRIGSHPDFGRRMPKLKRGETGVVLVFRRSESPARV